ncbi:MAG: DMT family transporter [Lachnospiraceae bacterium]|nr:DMT family transporter [Lachnospiraceae bacterium]
MKKNNTYLQNTLVVCLLATVCCILWGSAFPCIKIGYQLFSIESTDIPTQILFAGMRFTLAGILAIILGSLLSRQVLIPKLSITPKILKLCLLQTVLQYLFFYVGLANTSGVKASIIEAANVFIAILVSSLLFRQEKLSSRKMMGCLIGFAGVVLINLNGGSIDTTLKFTGEGFILLSTVAYAFSSVLLKSYSQTENPVMLSGYQFVLGGIIMMVCGAVTGGHIKSVTPAGWLMLFYLACISAVAYSIWGILLKYNPVSKVAVFGFMNPVSGVILSALLLRESSQAFGITAVAALILVCIGIYTVNKV